MVNLSHLTTDKCKKKNGNNSAHQTVIEFCRVNENHTLQELIFKGIGSTPELLYFNGFCSSLNYSQFHKTLPNSSLQMHWTSVRFYKMGDSYTYSWVPLFLFTVYFVIREQYNQSPPPTFSQGKQNVLL